MYSYRTVTVQASQFGAWGLTTNTGNSPPIQKGAPAAMQRCLITASRRTANANGDTEAGGCIGCFSIPRTQRTDLRSRGDRSCQATLEERTRKDASTQNALRCNAFLLKGIVHPKMKILSSFTHPQVVPNLYECLCSAEHKGRYSEECGKQSSSGTPVFFFLQWKSMAPQNSLVTNFLQNIFLCVRQNKEIHTGLELLEGEFKSWKNFHFWVNYPFNWPHSLSISSGQWTINIT